MELNMRDPKNKAEAIAFVSAVMHTRLALMSPDFQVALDVSDRFDVSVRDVLEYRREKARSA